MEADPMSMKFNRRMMLLSGALAVMAGSLAAAAEDAAVTKLTAAQLAAKLANKDFFLVNVHIPYQGEIKNTDAFIAFDRIADHLDQLPSDKAAPIVLYCRSGRMSDIASKVLAHLGYSQVSDLAGGMNGWKDAGLPIIVK